MSSHAAWFTEPQQLGSASLGSFLSLQQDPVPATNSLLSPHLHQHQSDIHVGTGCSFPKEKSSCLSLSSWCDTQSEFQDTSPSCSALPLGSHSHHFRMSLFPAFLLFIWFPFASHSYPLLLFYYFLRGKCVFLLLFSVLFLLSFPSCLSHDDIFVHAITSLLFLLFPLGYFDLLLLCLFYTFLFLPPKTHQPISHSLLLPHLSFPALIYSCCTKLVSCVNGLKTCPAARLGTAVSAEGSGLSVHSP